MLSNQEHCTAFPIIKCLLILPCFLAMWLAGHRAGYRHPAQSIQLPNKTENVFLTKLSRILGKLGKVIKLRKKLLIKLLSDYFSENSRWVFGQFSENLRINRKPWENNFGLIPWKYSFVKIFFRRIVGKLSEYFRFCHLINYLLTGLFVPYHEIQSPRFLHTDLASSGRTSKPRA